MATVSKINNFDLVSKLFTKGKRATKDIRQCMKANKTLQLIFTVTDRAGYISYLEGTLETVFKGTTYHTPVQVWVSTFYPDAPPVVYVIPTKGLFLRSGVPYLEANGKCNIPYIQKWNSESTLFGLCESLKQHFSNQPPLLAQPSNPGFVPQTANNVKQFPPSGYNSSQYPPQNPQGYNPYPQQSNPNQPYANMNANSSYNTTVNLPPYQQNTSAPTTQNAQQTMQLQQLLKARIHSKIHELYSNLVSEINQQMEIQEKLNNNSKNVQKVVEELSTQKLEVESATQNLSDHLVQLNEWINNTERNQSSSIEYDIDRLIAVKNPLQEQYLDSVSADNAFEDVLYTLDNALKEETITTEVYLREIRDVARRQFMERAMCQKIENMLALSSRKASFSKQDGVADRTNIQEGFVLV